MKKLSMTLGLLLLASCAGIHAREEGLMRAMELTWDSSIVTNVERGAVGRPDEAAIRAEAARMGPALESRDRSQVGAVNWPILRLVALDGVDVQQAAGEIGPGVAKFLRDEVDAFNRSFLVLLSR